jgi:hypothetical protein
MGTKCPEWGKDFSMYEGEMGADVDYTVLIQMVWGQLLTGGGGPVVITSGNLVFIGTLEDVGGGVEMTIEIGQLNFRWSSIDSDDSQLEIPYEA